jgi:hypothetical protein
MLLRVSNKTFHLKTDMFSYLSPTALNKSAKDVFCDPLHGIYQSVACFLNAIEYHSIRPNVTWFTPVIKVRLPLRLESHTRSLRRNFHEIGQEIWKELIEIHLRLRTAWFLLCCFYGTQNHSMKSMSWILFKSSKMWAIYISSPQQSTAYTGPTVTKLNNIQHK